MAGQGGEPVFKVNLRGLLAHRARLTLTVLAIALGTALGLGAALATAFTRSQRLTVVIPVRQIVIYAVAAAFAGLLPTIAPARRAARMNMVAAMATE
jgi:putative ABC transport system permease protein